jgi:hypothetical protein
MDILFWTALNPEIKQLETTKVMHRHYLYRLAIHAPGASMLRHDGDIDQMVEKRNNSIGAAYNYGGSWHRRILTADNVDFLKFVKSHVHDHESTAPRTPVISNDIRMRIEDPCIQFYSRNDLALRNLANTLRWKDNKHFVSIMAPTSDANAKFLLDGFVLRKRAIEWPYRLVFRDGRYSKDTKQQLLSYFEALGDQIKVPRGLSDQLTKGGWIWGGYIYAQDANLQSMLTLIEPRLVTKVEEFKSLATDE